MTNEEREELEDLTFELANDLFPKINYLVYIGFKDERSEVEEEDYWSLIRFLTSIMGRLKEVDEFWEQEVVQYFRDYYNAVKDKAAEGHEKAQKVAADLLPIYQKTFTGNRSEN